LRKPSTDQLGGRTMTRPTINAGDVYNLAALPLVGYGESSGAPFGVRVSTQFCL